MHLVSPKKAPAGTRKLPGKTGCKSNKTGLAVIMADD